MFSLVANCHSQAPTNQGQTSQPQGRIIAIDYGRARIGMAMSDERRVIASPLSTLASEKTVDLSARKVAQKLQELAKEGYEISTIVLGMPLMMSGKMSLMADEATLFAKALGDLVSIPVVSWDERLSSVQADRSMREAKLSRKKRAQRVDATSCILILQSYLDAISCAI